jgi:hypothetical protein
MRGSTPQSPVPTLAPTAVYGLDAGRNRARRAQRSRRRWNQLVTLAMGIAVATAVVAGAWFGYQAYLEHTRNAEIEHQLGVEEQARRSARQSTEDVIDQLEETPAFNGPGAPALGLGSATTEP